MHWRRRNAAKSTFWDAVGWLGIVAIKLGMRCFELSYCAAPAGSRALPRAVCRRPSATYKALARRATVGLRAPRRRRARKRAVRSAAVNRINGSELTHASRRNR